MKEGHCFVSYNFVNYYDTIVDDYFWSNKDVQMSTEDVVITEDCFNIKRCLYVDDVTLFFMFKASILIEDFTLEMQDNINNVLKPIDIDFSRNISFDYKYFCINDIHINFHESMYNFSIVYFHECDDVTFIGVDQEVMENKKDLLDEETAAHHIKDAPQWEHQYYIPVKFKYSEEECAEGFEKLAQYPKSYLYEGVLYKRHFLGCNVLYYLTMYKPLCSIYISACS